MDDEKDIKIIGLEYIISGLKDKLATATLQYVNVKAKLEAAENETIEERMDREGVLPGDIT